MKYTVKNTSRFQKNLKKLEKRKYNLQLLTEVVKILAKGEILPEKYKDHKLKGNLSNYRECHIQGDWILVYEYDNDNLILYLTRTGSHTDVFIDM